MIKRGARTAASLLAAGGLCLGLQACSAGVHTGVAIPAGSAAAADAARNAVTVSPLPGTPDASPETQISFLGGRGTKVLKVHAVGSKTGYDPGRLKAYSTGTGESFIPAHHFAAGETVAVYARVRTSAGAERNVGTIFRIAYEAREPIGGAAGRSAGRADVLGDSADVRAIRRTQDGTTWVDTLTPIRMNLSRHGGARHGVLADSVIEELDAKTGLVMWQWHALGHIPLSDARAPAPPSSSPWDYAGIAAVEPAGSEDVLLSPGSSGKPYDVSIHTGALR